MAFLLDTNVAIHLRGARVMAANAHLVSQLPDDVVPAVTADAAQQEALTVVAKRSPGTIIADLASLPSREELIGKLAGIFVSQVQQFVNITTDST